MIIEESPGGPSPGSRIDRLGSGRDHRQRRHSDADGCLRERWRVIHAVPHHRDDPALRLQSLDVSELLFRQKFRVEIVDAEALRY